MKRLIIALMCILAAPLAAADDLSYSYAEGWYSDIDFDGIDGDALGGGVSVEVSDATFIYGAYESGEINTWFDDVDISTLQIGGGWHTPFTDSTDFVVQGGGFRADVSDYGDAEWGANVGAGVRGAVTQVIILEAGIQYAHFWDSDIDGELSTSVGGEFRVSESLSLNAGYTWGEDDVTSWNAGVRVYF